MSTPNTSNFLRRTAVALAAVAGLAISLHVSAQSNALKKSTGETICTYSGLSVTPTGGITVTCDGSVTPPPPPPPVSGPGTYSMSGPSSLAVSESATFTINRNNGNTGDTIIGVSAAGGCTTSKTSMTFPNGGITQDNFVLTAPATAGTCTVYLSMPAGAGSLESPTYRSVAITSSSLPPPVTQPGCPAPPNDIVDFDLKLSGADRLQMASGRIAAALLPKVSDTRPIGASGQIIFGEATISPRAATVEVSVTKCRGVIDTNPSNGAFCYARLTNGAFMKMEWIEKPIWGASTDGVANAYKLCKAYQTDGPFYVNVRYTYSPADCTWGGTCGYTDQWNYAAY